MVVGRLLEIALPNGYRTVRDVEAIDRQLVALFESLPQEVRPVIVADWRHCRVLTPAVAERAVEMMTRTNARIARSAILHAVDASTSVLQLMRLIRETEVSYRRLFTEPHQLQLWLSEELGAAELERLRAFLLGTRPSAQRQ